jgi:transcriptional regulator with XRE-family HTH domain
MTIASTLLHSGRTASKLSQRSLARQTRTDQPAIAAIEKGTRDPSIGTLDRLLRGTGHSLVSAPTRTPPVAVFTDEIRHHLALGEVDAAFRVFLTLNDALRSESPGIQVVLTIADPGTTGSDRFDALTAGLVEHILGGGGLPVPEWVNAPSRFLADSWFVDDSPYARAHDTQTVPAAFARRGVILAPSELESV